MPELPLTGGCMCGGVRFEIDRPLVQASWCHCSRCRRRTGTGASVQGWIEPGALRVVQGEELIRSYRFEEGWAKVFCRECGSSLWSEDPSGSGRKAVRFGAFDADPGIEPSYHQFVDYAPSWAPVPDDGLPRYPERKPA